MVTIILFFIILFVYLAFWISYNYIKLIFFSSCVKKYFSEIDVYVLENVFPISNTDKTEKYKEWYMKTDDINRKLALCKEINKELNNTEKFEQIAKSSIETYNKYALKLKVATEVFPTSFIARLKEIKKFNSYS